MVEAKVVVLDDFRPRVTERMQCLFCGLTHVLRHLANRRQPYFECPGCDETASVPEWSLRMR
jgi:transposase-like protein